MSWFRLPTWCIGRDHREEAVVVMWILGEWHVGREVSAAGLRSEFGWGWARSAAMIDRLWTWAGEEGAARPDVPRAPKNGTETKPVSQRRVSGESPVSRDTGATPIVEEARRLVGESSVSQRCVSRARTSLERDEDERRERETILGGTPPEREIPNPEKWAALFPTTPPEAATEAPPAPSKPKLQDRIDLAIRTVYAAYRLTHPKKSPTVSPQDRKAIKAMLDECGGTTAAAIDEATATAVLMIEWVAQSQDERARQVRGEAPWPRGDLTKRDELPSLGSNAGSRVEMVRAWNARGRCDEPPVFRPTPSARPSTTPFVSIADMIAGLQSTQPPTRTGVVIDIEEPN